MALTNWSAANFLQRLEAVWPGQLPFLVSIWCWKDNPAPNGNAFSLGQQSDDLQWRRLIHRASDDTMLVQSRGGGPIATAGISPTPDVQWFHVLVGWISPTLREIWVNGGSRQTDTLNTPVNPPDVTTIGVLSDFTGPWQAAGALAEFSGWDGAGLDLQARGDLAALLANGGNPLATNSVGGAPWQGNLVQTPVGPAYASMHTPTNLGPFELVGNLSVFEVGGIPNHPPVAVPEPQVVRFNIGSSIVQTNSVPIEVTEDDGDDLGIIAIQGWRVTPPGESPNSIVRGAQSFENLGPLGSGSFFDPINETPVNAKSEFWILRNPDVGIADVTVTQHPSQVEVNRGQILFVILYRFLKQSDPLRAITYQAFSIPESGDPATFDPDPEPNLNETVLAGLTYSRGFAAASTLLEGFQLANDGTGGTSADARLYAAINREAPVTFEITSSSDGTRLVYMIAAVPNSSFLPDAPTALTVVGANDQEAFLAWQHAGGPGIFYELQRAIDIEGEPGTYNVVVEGISEMEARDDEVGPALRYWWRVRSQEGGLLSGWSNDAVATMAPARPAGMSLTLTEP